MSMKTFTLSMPSSYVLQVNPCICIIISLIYTFWYLSTCTVSSIVTILLEFSCLAVAGPDLADPMDRMGEKAPDCLSSCAGRTT